MLGESQNLPERRRVDGATVNQNFCKAIAEKGGDDKAQPRAAEALTREVMGCGTKELYAATGGKKGDRSTLPIRAQEAMMVGEVVATYDLKERQIEGSQSERNHQIVASVRDSGRKARKHFPW